jgi:hypothetical protein
MSERASDVDAWLDTVAIQDLVVRYSDAATRGAWDEFEAVWTADGVWDVRPPVGTHIVGIDAIMADVKALLNAEDFFVQMTHGSVVTLLGNDRARSTTTIHALARREGHHNVTNYGVYYDDLVKVDGTWKFARRSLQPVYMDTSPLPGIAPITRAELGSLPSPPAT